VDGAPVGTTPLEPLNLGAGAHTVQLTHPDYRPIQRKVTIEAGAITRIEIDLKLDGVAKNPSGVKP
jgi:hypothetical protein